MRKNGISWELLNLKQKKPHQTTHQTQILAEYEQSQVLSRQITPIYTNVPAWNKLERKPAF